MKILAAVHRKDVCHEYKLSHAKTRLAHCAGKRAGGALADRLWRWRFGHHDPRAGVFLYPGTGSGNGARQRGVQG